MNKKIIFCVSFFALFLLAQKGLAATLTIAPASGNYVAGDTFSVQVFLNTQTVATDGVDLHYLRFNNALLKLNSVSLGTLYTTTMANAIDNNSGTYNFSQITAGGTRYTGSGTLLTLNFQALGAGTAVVSFDYTAEATADCNVSASGADVLSQATGASFTIVANQLPTATATATPTSGTAPLSVQFTGGGADTDGAILSYLWNFGDNTTSSLQSPSHIYTNPGNYSAVLTATDNRGGSGSKTIAISATSLTNQAPTVTATAIPASGVAPLTVQFTGNATDTDGIIVSYSWNFGDNTASSSLQSPSHTFVSAGTYQVFLTVKDDKDAVGSKSISITVTTPVAVNSNQGGGGGGDTTAPSISNILVVPVNTQATITWTTNESSLTWVVYGTSTAYAWQQKGSAYTSTHSVVLTNLQPGAIYHYQLKSQDSSGNVGNYTDKTFMATGTSATTTATTSTIPTTSLINPGQVKPISQMTIAELRAKILEIGQLIVALRAELTKLTGAPATPSTMAGIPANFTFKTTLKFGMALADVKYLQIVLNSDPTTLVAVSGKGSLGKENTYFGNLTKLAVMKFQEKYKLEILTPMGLVKGTGRIDDRTRQKLNQILLEKFK